MKKKSFAIAVLVLAGFLVWLMVAKMNKLRIRHIVLISIDTCRADHLSCYGYPLKTTPNIDAFAGDATRFEHVITPAPITLPSHCTMLTGQTPPFHGVRQNTGYQLLQSSLTLPEMLKKKGFYTGAIISAFVLDKQFGMNQGFVTYNDTFKNAAIDPEHPQRKGDETTQLALDWIEKNQHRKSFLFLHYYDPHIDHVPYFAYTPPEPFASQFHDNPYAGEIAFTDHCIGKVLQKLKKLHLYDSSLIIITSDHGEMLGEHGERTHGFFLYEPVVKVPMIVKLPFQKEAQTISESVGLVDIVPTICSLLNIDSPTDIQGRDVSPLLIGNVPEGYERFLYSDNIGPMGIGASSLAAISHGKWKYIQAPRPELYNTEADAGENNNLIEEEPHRARILADKVKEILEQSANRDKDSSIELDAESIKRLESLGYVAGKSNGDIAYDKNQRDPKDLINFHERFWDARLLHNNREDGKAKNILIDILDMNPDYYGIHLMLGDVEMGLKSFNSAIVHYRRGLQLNPTAPLPAELYAHLAWLQATNLLLPARDVDEAVLYAEKACEQTSFRDPKLLATLAVAYAAAEDFQKAVETDQKAYELARKTYNGNLAREISKHLKLFKQSKPYYEE